MRMTLLGGFAGTVFIPLTGWLADTCGWRGALMILAAINLLAAAPLHWLVLAGDRVEPVAEGQATPRGASMGALRQRAFSMLVATCCNWSHAFGSLTLHLLPLLAQRGVSDALGLALLAHVGPLHNAGPVGPTLPRE